MAADPADSAMLKALLPASVNEVPAGIDKSCPLTPASVSVFAPEVFNVTPMPLLTNLNVAICCVGTLFTIGVGVTLPSKIKASVVDAVAAVGRIGDQLVGTCQS